MVFKKKITNIIFWGIISAAFIGPGTVTTATQAGASYGVSLLWALTFATVATVFLQEASARIAISSGKNLGEAIALKYSGSKGAYVRYFVVFSIILGGAAYQAGNILGAVSGLSLNFLVNQNVLTILIVLLAGLLLWLGNTKYIARILGFVVALMGLLFIWVAFGVDQKPLNILSALILPSFPENSSLLIVGLIGTTIVPYNLFLAAGVAKGQTIKEMRFGLAWAIILGGVISMAVLIAGTTINGEFSFQSLSGSLDGKLGNWASVFFGFGLFAAGFTSAVTAPLASAITLQTVFPDATTGSKRFKAVWLFILTVGLIFGVSGVRPIPVIILAQALNGLLLPFVTILIYRIINEKAIMAPQDINGMIGNIVLILIGGVTTFLGLNNVSKALATVLKINFENQQLFAILGTLSVLVCLWLGRSLVIKN